MEDGAVGKTLDDMLARPYPHTVIPDLADGGFVIVFPDLPGCMTQVETGEEIAPIADEIRRLWIAAGFDLGHDIPPPSTDGAYRGRFVVRLPRSLHRRLAEAAEREGISLNAWVTTLLAQGTAGTGTAEGRRLVA